MTRKNLASLPKSYVHYTKCFGTCFMQHLPIFLDHIRPGVFYTSQEEVKCHGDDLLHHVLWNWRRGKPGADPLLECLLAHPFVEYTGGSDAIILQSSDCQEECIIPPLRRRYLVLQPVGRSWR